MSPAKTVKPISMLLRIWTHGGPRTRVLGNDQIPHGKRHFWVAIPRTFPYLPCVNILNLIHKGEPAVLPLATHTHPFNGPLSGTTCVSRYQKGKTSLDFTEARDSEWQWHQLGHMQVCTLLQTDNHASTPAPHSVFLQAGCRSCHPINSVKALKVACGYQ